MTMEDELYKQNIIEHYKYPHNKGKPKQYSSEFLGYNPNCGDNIILYLTVKDNVLTNISFEGDGCAISVAATSMLTDYVHEKSIETIYAITDSDMYSLLGVQVNPGREKCALLTLNALKVGLKKT